MRLLSLLSLLLLLGSPAVIYSQAQNEVDPGAVKVPEGYAVEAAVTGLSVPTTAVFQGENLIVAESGFLDTAKPRILKIAPDGSVTVLAQEGLEPPVTGLLYVNDTLYISHRGKVSRLETSGQLADIVTSLPSEGDHQNNNLVLGRDGRIYLGQGTATNAGVVGVDNYVFGWLDKRPQVHDVPCRDIILTGKNYETENPLTPEEDTAVTGAYKPFGTPSQPGEVINGTEKCNGAVLSFNPDGSDLRMVAWGLRNPYGLKVDANGDIWATFHGADVRGSRNIWNDPDYLVKITEGAWYGWPEYYNGRPVTDARFNAPGAEKPGFLWQDHPELTLPFAIFDSHSGTNGFAFSPSEKFGFMGDAFIAMFGTFTPVTTGPNVELSGFSVQRVDMDTGAQSPFAANTVPGPSYINRLGGLNRPSDVSFGPDDSMYVVDWGGAVITEKGLELQENTGIVWRIYNTQNQEARFAQGPVVVPPDPIPEEEHKPLARNAAETYKMVGRYFWPVGLVLLILLILWGYRRRR